MPSILVSDFDLNPAISYSLSGEGNDLFSIETSTGEITQSVPGKLDSELYTSIFLNVCILANNHVLLFFSSLLYIHIYI